MIVASFLAPRPKHPRWTDYRPLLSLLQESCERFDYEHVVLSDQKIVGFETRVYDLPQDLMKAAVAAQMHWLEEVSEDTLMVGADCVLANDPSDAFNETFDAAFTTGDFSDCQLNTGAIFVPKGSKAGILWKRALDTMGEAWGDDQKALAEQVKPLTLKHGIYERAGFEIAFLPVDPWNLAPDAKGHDCSHAKILHFRGDRKKWAVDYCRRFLGMGHGKLG